MLGREKLETYTSCELYNPKTETFGVGEVLLKDDVDKVMDAMERRIARLFNLVAGYQRNSLGLSAMYNRRLDSELERIQELESQLPKWISVKDRLPNEGEFVLVMRPKAFKYKMDVVMWNIHYYSNDATHWMPLPPPPTTEESEKED